jgi:hypothetical protein
MSAIKNIESNYLYNGNYKEMDCMQEFIKSQKKKSKTTSDEGDDIKEQKPEAVLCAYDKYIYESGVRNQDRLRRRAHQGIITHYCENSTNACRTQDEYGFQMEPDEMCLKVDACDEKMSLVDIVPAAISFFEVFNSLMDEIKPQRAHELLKLRNRRITAFKQEQAGIKEIEMRELKIKYSHAVLEEGKDYKKLLQDENEKRKEDNLPCKPIIVCKEEVEEVEEQKAEAEAEPEEKAANPGTPVEASDDNGSPTESINPTNGGENVQVSSVPAKILSWPKTRAPDALPVNEKNQKTFTYASSSSNNMLYGGSNEELPDDDNDDDNDDDEEIKSLNKMLILLNSLLENKPITNEKLNSFKEKIENDKEHEILTPEKKEELNKIDENVNEDNIQEKIKKIEEKQQYIKDEINKLSNKIKEKKEKKEEEKKKQSKTLEEAKIKQEKEFKSIDENYSIYKKKNFEVFKEKKDELLNEIKKDRKVIKAEANLQSIGLPLPKEDYKGLREFEAKKIKTLLMIEVKTLINLSVDDFDKEYSTEIRAKYKETSFAVMKAVLEERKKDNDSVMKKDLEDKKTDILKGITDVYVTEKVNEDFEKYITMDLEELEKAVDEQGKKAEKEKEENAKKAEELKTKGTTEQNMYTWDENDRKKNVAILEMILKLINKDSKAEKKQKKQAKKEASNQQKKIDKFVNTINAKKDELQAGGAEVTNNDDKKNTTTEDTVGKAPETLDDLVDLLKKYNNSDIYKSRIKVFVKNENDVIKNFIDQAKKDEKEVYGDVMENKMCKYDWKSAYDKYQDYIYYKEFKKGFTDTKFIELKIVNYENEMKKNLKTGILYKESMRLLDILQRHLDLEYQKDDLLASNIFSRAGKKIARFHKKGLRREKVRIKLNEMITKHSFERVGEAISKKTLKPVSDLGNYLSKKTKKKTISSNSNSSNQTNSTVIGT